MSRSPDEERSRTVLVVVSALAALAFFYSAFVVGQLLLGGLVVLFLFVLYSLYRLFGLLRRFVRAHERIATALESRTDVGRSDDRR
jgi:Flp pilus assembly protein TadB